MMWLPVLLLVAVYMAVSYRFHIAQLRRRIQELRTERDDLRKFIAIVAPESLPEIDA